MFPIRDHNPSRNTPYVTYALIAVNLGIFISYVDMMEDSRALWAFYARWALIPGTGDLSGYVTSMFLHGGWMHLLGNMLFLYIFGDNLEDEMGHAGFGLFYLVCGVLAAVVHVISDPGSLVPTVGASGAIAGVMGAYLLLFPRAKVDVLFIIVIVFKVVPLPAWVMLGAWFALQLFNGSTAGADASVAYWAHAGGFVAGVLAALPLWLRLGGVRFWSRTHGHPPHPETQYTTSRIPRVRRR